MESSLLLLKGTVSSGELSGKQRNSQTTWGLLRSSRAWEKWERSVKVLPSETSRQMKGTVADPPYEGTCLTVSQSQMLLLCL